MGSGTQKLLWITTFVFASKGVLRKVFRAHDLDLVADAFFRGSGDRAKWRQGGGNTGAAVDGDSAGAAALAG